MDNERELGRENSIFRLIGTIVYEKELRQFFTWTPDRIFRICHEEVFSQAILFQKPQKMHYYPKIWEKNDSRIQFFA